MQEQTHPATDATTLQTWQANWVDTASGSVLPVESPFDDDDDIDFLAVFTEWADAADCAAFDDW